MKQMQSIVLLLASAFLLMSCSQPAEATLPSATFTTAPVTEPTEESSVTPSVLPTDAPATEPVTEPTEPVTEPTEPAFTPELWRPSGDYLSYKEYFSKDRFFGYARTNSWIVLRGDEGYLFTLQV